MTLLETQKRLQPELLLLRARALQCEAVSRSVQGEHYASSGIVPFVYVDTVPDIDRPEIENGHLERKLRWL